MPSTSICCLREWRRWPSTEEKVHSSKLLCHPRSLEFYQVTSRCHLCSVLPRPGCLPDQEERTKAIEAFKEGKKDVLVATDVASKGLDFPAIQHVVNYDMPEEIENYGKADRVGSVVVAEEHLLKLLLFRPLVHRIGRTGRSGKTGIATTFINKGCGKKKKGSE